MNDFRCGPHTPVHEYGAVQYRNESHQCILQHHAAPQYYKTRLSARYIGTYINVTVATTCCKYKHTISMLSGYLMCAGEMAHNFFDTAWMALHTDGWLTRSTLPTTFWNVPVA